MTTAVPVSPRSALVLALASIAGLLAFTWPVLLRVDPASADRGVEAPIILLALLPLLVVVVLAELTDGGIDSRALALLGVLAAVNAALRPLGAGLAGIETVFALPILAGRVFGPGFGFVLGATSLFASALLTAGVGPWLPFQMLAAAWAGMGAGLLPRLVRGRAELAMLVAYGVAAAYAYGLLLNLWFWPFVAGIGSGDDSPTQLAYQAGAPLLENLGHFGRYTLATSTFGWDTGRAITTALAIGLLGRAVLSVLRRHARRTTFGTSPLPRADASPPLSLR